jgi:hypothetical protein
MEFLAATAVSTKQPMMSPQSPRTSSAIMELPGIRSYLDTLLLFPNVWGTKVEIRPPKELRCEPRLPNDRSKDKLWASKVMYGCTNETHKAHLSSIAQIHGEDEHKTNGRPFWGGRIIWIV